MNDKNLLDAMGGIDPKLIIGAAPDAKQKKPAGAAWVKWVAIAACFCLIVSAIVVVPMFLDGNPEVSPEGETATESTAEPDRPSIPIENAQAPSSAPQYYGSESSADISGGASAERIRSGVSVTASLIQALPDTYTFFNDWKQTEFRLLRMKVITVLEGVDMPDEIYYIVPADYMTDFNVYDKFVCIDMAQYGYEYSVVYNQTKGCAEQLHAVLFGYSCINFGKLGENLMAFDAQGDFDIHLWTATESWTQSTQFTVAQNGTSYYDDYTLENAENAARESGHGGDFHYVHFLESVKGDAAKALDYVTSFDNGIYVPSYHDGYILALGPEIQFGIRKYIGGFATNESAMIYEDSVSWSNARFTKEDEQSLPDLQAAIDAVANAYDAGKLTPPNFKYADQSEIESYGIFGWYAKTENGVIGIVRVTWCYRNTQLGHYITDRYYDDAYYIIEPGQNECSRIQKDALCERIGQYETSYIFNGNYDAYGKIVDDQYPVA